MRKTRLLIAGATLAVTMGIGLAGASPAHAAQVCVPVSDTLGACVTAEVGSGGTVVGMASADAGDFWVHAYVRVGSRPSACLYVEQSGEPVVPLCDLP